ncbi:Holliday junction resolvase RuvX [Deinococcus roseus]|uniref:Putative pre-16S rRNA nuclease n=1 Tax=Deinococcus roseus TaxID=392414 RepID=A0ABQ2DDS5_9DEIO|nr:Holliday junction resolvase RuvX [Deinococcus roseus]GGJ53081.1 putative pre-16S rRNA nuclease [Deinococcus roseus]
MADTPANPDTTYLALDASPKRIGFAVSYGRLAFGRGYLHRQKLQNDVAAVQAKMQQEEATEVVMGLPLRTDGLPSKQAQRVRALGHALRQAGVTVHYQDERFTTISADEDLKGRFRAKGELDEASAVRILQLFLED